AKVRDREPRDIRTRRPGRDGQDHGKREGRGSAQANRPRTRRDSGRQCAGSAEGSREAALGRRLQTLQRSATRPGRNIISPGPVLYCARKATGMTSMSMQSVASPALPFTPPKRNELKHIPGDEGWPIIGKTFQVLADPKGFVEASGAKYGPVYRTHMFGETNVVLLGPEANELVLFDQQKLFSSTHGWTRVLGLLFPRGLMLLDSDEHRLHRKALSVAFKSGPMKSYLADLDRGISARVAQWKAKPGVMQLYPAMKQLTLDLAA